MDFFNFIAILLTVVAILSYFNYRYIKLPTAIGLMGISLLISLLLVELGSLGFDFQTPTKEILAQVDFSEALMKGMLSFLLFAGSIQFRVKDFDKQKYVIGILSTVGVAVSSFIVGGFLFGVSYFLELGLPVFYCLIFGALISPTDTVAVLALLKDTKLGNGLEKCIIGESLFNDGVSVVLFVLITGIVQHHNESLSADQIAMLLMRQIVGGVLFGAFVGWIACRLLRKVEQLSVEVIISLATACGSYAMAHHLNLSGPIAVVLAGLLIGSQKRSSGRRGLTEFWEIIDELLNSVLFVWIGLVVLAFTFTKDKLQIGLITIPITLFGRFLSVWLAITLFDLQAQFSKKSYWFMTWGGVRGGVSVALALSIPASEHKALIVAITYIVVAFSILVQGSTLRRFV